MAVSKAQTAELRAQAGVEIEPRIETTMETCAGACASFAIKSLGVRGGVYKPEFAHEKILRDVRIVPSGRSFQTLLAWIKKNLPELNRLGYRVNAQRVAQPPEVLCGWVANGNGFRVAILATDRFALYPGARMSGSHAVALVLKYHEALGESHLVMADPWPHTTTELAPPDTLREAAHLLNNAAILFYWCGWS